MLLSENVNCLYCFSLLSYIKLHWGAARLNKLGNRENHKMPEDPQKILQDNDELFFADEDDEVIFAEENDDKLIFYKDEVIFSEEEKFSQNRVIDSWKVLLVDDEIEIHNVTELALNNFTFEGKNLTFLNAYSGQEAKSLIENNPDTAMILLDVIMETEDAGLEVVQYIRDILNNHLVQIILRTGQPGKLQEDQIIFRYGINDYKTKTELNRQKLVNEVTTKLREFKTIVEIEKRKRELEQNLMEKSNLCKHLNNKVEQLEKEVEQLTKEINRRDKNFQEKENEYNKIIYELNKTQKKIKQLCKTKPERK